MFGQFGHFFKYAADKVANNSYPVERYRDEAKRLLSVLEARLEGRDYLMGETELVVIVEPYIVSPTSPGRMQTPADGLRIANDAQTIFFGQLNQAYGSPAPTAQPGAGWHGPVGYVIE